MSKVLELVNQSKENNKGRKTKNAEEYANILIAILTDEEYVAKELKEIKDNQVIIEDKKIAPGFKKIVIAAFKKAGMSEEEAKEAANSFKVTKEMAQSIVEAVRETDYLVLHECGKKIQLFRKPGLEINLTIEDAKESIRPNPRDKEQKIRIKARKRVKVQQILHPFQKELVEA